MLYRPIMDTAAITRKLIEVYGGEEALAAELGVGQSSINRWSHGKAIRSDGLFKLLALASRLPETAALVSASGPPSLPPRPDDVFVPQAVIPGAELVGDKNFPVYAAAMGGDGHQIVTFDPIDFVKRPAILENVKGAYGVYIVGESMVPAYEPGDMALIHPHLPPARDKNVVLYHVPPSGNGEAEAIVKRLLRWNEREWFLLQYNPTKEFSEARSDWMVCHRIVGKYEAR